MKNIRILIIFLFASACNRDEKIEMDTILVQNTKAVYSQQLNSKIVNQVHYTILETNKLSLVPEIPKQIIFTNSRIFIVDNIRSGCLWIFDRGGKFLSKLKPTGEGPGEYMSARAVGVDTFNKKIELLEDSKKTVLEFDFNGNLIQERPSKIYFDNIAYLKNGSKTHQIVDVNLNEFGSQIICENVKNQYTPLFRDMAMAPIWKFGSTFLRNSVFEAQGKIYYCKPFCDTIHNITDGTYHIDKLLKFEKSMETKEILSLMDKTSSSAINIAFNNNIPFLQDFFYTTDKYTYFTYMFNKQNVFFLYDNKKNKPLLNCNMVSIPQIGLPLPSSTLGYCSNGIVCLLPHSLIKLIMSTLSPEDKKKISPELMKIYNKMKPEDNPILIKVEFN